MLEGKRPRKKEERPRERREKLLIYSLLRCSLGLLDLVRIKRKSIRGGKCSERGEENVTIALPSRRCPNDRAAIRRRGRAVKEKNGFFLRDDKLENRSYRCANDDTRPVVVGRVRVTCASLGNRRATYATPFAPTRGAQRVRMSRIINRLGNCCYCANAGTLLSFVLDSKRDKLRPRYQQASG